MTLSDWLDMEDQRPGVPAVTVRKKARLMLQARTHSFFSATCPDLQTLQEACLFYTPAPLASWVAFIPESLLTHLFLLAASHPV